MDEGWRRIGLLIGVVVVAAVVVGGGIFAVTWGVDYVEEVQADMGNVTIQGERVGEEYVVTVHADDLQKADYLNVVVNGNTDDPRPGVEVEAPEVTTEPREEPIGGVDGDGPLEGPPDVDADATGQEVRVTGLRPGDTVQVIAVDTAGSAEGGYQSVTQILIESYTVSEDQSAALEPPEAYSRVTSTRALR